MVNKNVLVWGGAGYIGSVLIQQLLDAGYYVFVADNLYKGGKHLVNFINNPNFFFLKKDIRVQQDVVDLGMLEWKAVVVLSGIVGLDACNKNQQLSREVNVDGWKNVAEHNYSNSPLIGSSTGSVYGEITNGLCTELTKPNPLSIYAETKLEGEKYLMDADGIIYRYATAGGISPNMRFNLLPNELMFLANKNHKLNIYEGGNMRTFIDIRDFGLSILFAIENFANLKYQMYNVGSNDNNWSKKRLATRIQELTGCELSFHETAKDPDARNYMVDYSRLNNEGFQCKYSVDNMLQSLKSCYEIWKNPEEPIYEVQ